MLSSHPFLDVERGETYYAELSRDGAPFSVLGAAPRSDPYPAGAA